MNADPQINPDQAVDLSDAKYLAEQREAAEERARQQAEVKTVTQWERGMHRIFKGIITRGQRRTTLRKIGRDIEAGTHGPKPTFDKKPRSRGGGPYYR